MIKLEFDVFVVFKQFHTMVQNQFGTPIKVFISDNGGEFFSKIFQDYSSSVGIIYETICPHTSQQNRVVESNNFHILETNCSLMLGAHISTYFWAEAVTTMVFLINRLPSWVLNFKSPLSCCYHITLFH